MSIVFLAHAPSVQAVEMVREFHRVFGHPVNDPSAADARLGVRLEWTSDEIFELYRAMRDDDDIEIADAIADALYFIYGTAVESGAEIPWGEPDDSHDGDVQEALLFVSSQVSAAISSWAFGAGAEEALVFQLAPAERVLREVAASYGLDIDAVLREVHRSNMAKVWPDGEVHCRPDGKVVKPDGWTAPDVAGVLAGRV